MSAGRNRASGKRASGAAAKGGVATGGAAKAAHDRLVLHIRAFEARLDQSQEIAMGFAGGEAGVLRIAGIGYSDPDILAFYGTDEDGLQTQLIQHVSQLSVILRAVPKLAPEEPPRRIGFSLGAGWRGGEAGDGSAWSLSAQGPAG